jgi:hypothetical protein
MAVFIVQFVDLCFAALSERRKVSMEGSIFSVYRPAFSLSMMVGSSEEADMG